jgi:hypothetical protein
LHNERGVELRCKVFRATDALELEEAINRFLGEELPSLGDVQFEEITQSEGGGGVTVVVWYSLVDTETDEIEEGPEELDAGRELA